MTASTPPAVFRRPLTWKNGGWLLALLGIVCVGGALAVLFGGPRRQGDGQRVESYGFELSHLLVPKAKVVAGGMPQDFLKALDSPPTLGPADLARENGRNPYRKFLLPHDRVLGVVRGGEARAYPLNSLMYHEVINDTVGGRAILVTYHALCDSAVVFERGAAGEGMAPCKLRVSGLLYNSNLLMYDVAGPGRESLWSQLEGRAISGPSAGKPLNILACAVTTWEVWLRDHPETRIMAPDPETEKPLADISYTNYFATDRLKFPVDPAWNAKVMPNKTPVLAVRMRDSATWRVYVIPELAGLDPSARAKVLHMAGVKFTWHDADLKPPVTGPSLVAEALSPDQPISCVYSFIFAWHALHPEDGDVVKPAASGGVGLETSEPLKFPSVAK